MAASGYGAALGLKRMSVIHESMSVHNTMVLKCVNALAPGYTYSTRVGDSVYGEYLRVSVRVMNNTGNTNPSSTRLFVLLDRQPNGVQPADTDIFQWALNTGYASLSDILFTARQRFTLLWDELVGFSSDYGGNSVGEDKPAFYVVKIPLNKLQTTYAGVAGTYADITTNTLWFGHICYNATGTQLQVDLVADYCYWDR